MSTVFLREEYGRVETRPEDLPRIQSDTPIWWLRQRLEMLIDETFTYQIKDRRRKPHPEIRKLRRELNDRHP